MRARNLIYALAGAAFMAGMSPAAEKAAPEPAAAATVQETKEQRDARMQWWRDAKFGMFIHYGLYSGLAG